MTKRLSKQRGLWSMVTPPCRACHRDGSGEPIETPVLCEQRYEYIIAQLESYASGARRNDVYARMRTIAAKLTP